MNIPDMTTDLNIIAALGDRPNTDNNLTAAQLKAKFDEAGNAIKTYINGTLVDTINSGCQDKIDGVNTLNGAYITPTSIPGSALANGAVNTTQIYSGAVTTGKIDGGAVTYAKLNADAKSKPLTGTAAEADWDYDAVNDRYYNEVTVTGLAAADNIIVSPAPSSFLVWRDNGVYCGAQADGKVTLYADELVEGANISVQVLVVR